MTNWIPDNNPREELKKGAYLLGTPDNEKRAEARDRGKWGLNLLIMQKATL
jgi:hypothetical protein